MSTNYLPLVIQGFAGCEFESQIHMIMILDLSAPACVIHHSVYFYFNSNRNTFLLKLTHTITMYYTSWQLGNQINTSHTDPGLKGPQMGYVSRQAGILKWPVKVKKSLYLFSSQPLRGTWEGYSFQTCHGDIESKEKSSSKHDSYLASAPKGPW